MSKVILVMEHDGVCACCPLNFWNRCRALNEQHIENPSDEKLPNCPLKPAPERIDVPAFDYNMQAKNKNAEEVGMYMYNRGHYRGYNICVREILGE